MTETSYHEVTGWTKPCAKCRGTELPLPAPPRPPLLPELPLPDLPFSSVDSLLAPPCGNNGNQCNASIKSQTIQIEQPCP